MECTTATNEVYGPYNAKLGQRGADGNIWSGRTLIFRIIDDRVYSMHEQYLGRLKYGMAMTDRGELIFTIVQGFESVKDALISGEREWNTISTLR